MSAPAGLPKKLRRFFNEVRREAKRNPDFAARLDRALDALAPDSLLDDEDDHIDGVDALDLDIIAPPEPAFVVNPLAIVRRDGADALRDALHDVPLTALRGLVLEHNLDPAGETGAMDESALIGHIVRQAARRIERDKKLFDY